MMTISHHFVRLVVSVCLFGLFACGAPPPGVDPQESSASVGGSGSDVGGSTSSSPTGTGGAKNNGTGGSTGSIAVTQPFCNPATPSRAAQCDSLSGTSAFDNCCMVWSAVDACRAAGQAVQTPNPMSCCVAEYYQDAYNLYKTAASSLVAQGKLPTITSWESEVVSILGDPNKIYSLCVGLFSSSVIGLANTGKNGLGSTPATT